MPNGVAAPPAPSSARLVLAGGLLLALLVGLVGGLFGFEAQALLVLFGVPAIALLVDQRLALLLFIMLVPYNGAEDIPRTAQNIVFFGIAALFGVRLLLSRVITGRYDLPLPRQFVLYALLFTAATAIGVTHLREISPAYLFRMGVGDYGLKEYVVGVYARQFTLVVMAATIIWLIASKRSRPDWIVGVALASGTLFVLLMVAVLAVRGFPLGELSSRSFFAVLGRHSNSLASMLLLLLCSSLYMWEFSAGGLRRLLLGGVTLLLTLGVVLSASRGAILAMLLVFAWYVIEVRRLRALFVGVLIVSVAALAAPESVQERMFRGFGDRGGPTLDASQGYDDALTSGRMYIWSRLAPEVLEHPLIGGGLSSTQWSEFARNAEYFAIHPHSLYLGLLMDTGLVGTFIVMWWYLYLWRTLRMLARDSRMAPHLRGYFRGAAVGLAAYLFYGLVNSHWYPGPDQVFLWVAAGLAIGTRALLGPSPQEQAAAATVRRPTLQGRIPHPWRPAPRQ